MTVKKKPFWQSSTLWINVIGIVAIIISYVLKLEVVKDSEVVALLVAILNIANRFRDVPKQNLTLK